jgi:hypothetical protein
MDGIRMKPFLYLLSLTLVRRDRFGDLPDRGQSFSPARRATTIVT